MDEIINSAYRRFVNWKKDDETLVFLYVTDLHSALETSDCLNSQKRETLSHIKTMNRAAEIFQADFTANLGDCGVEIPVKPQDDVKALLGRLEEYHSASPVRPVIYAIGNHDIKQQVTPQYWGNFMLKLNAGCDINTPSGGTYGFFDFHDRKARVFYLFCNETKEFYSEEQLAWFSDHLNRTPSGYCAVVVQHICIRQKGRWRAHADNPTAPRFVELHNILASFVKSGGSLAGVFSGDSHFNLTDAGDGVFYFSSQGYGGAGPSEAPDHALRSLEVCPALGRCDSFNSDKTPLIEAVAIKPARRETAVFRIGAGDSEFDLTTRF